MIKEWLNEFFDRAVLMHLGNPDASQMVVANPSLQKMFGPKPLQNMRADYVWLDDKDRFLMAEGTVDWTAGPQATGLTLGNNDVTMRARPGDGLCVAMKKNGNLFVVVVPKDETVYVQVFWLFNGTNDTDFDHRFLSPRHIYEREVTIIERMILGELGLVLGWY